MTYVKEVTMHASRNAATCLWAVPTLFLRAPFWFEAENAPWSCVREPALRVSGWRPIHVAC